MHYYKDYPWLIIIPVSSLQALLDRQHYFSSFKFKTSTRLFDISSLYFPLKSTTKNKN